MMATKRSRCVLLFGILAVVLAPSVTASHNPAKATFAPRSHVRNPKKKEASIPTRDAALHHQVAARGGADSASTNAAVSALAFFVLDYASKKFFKANNISFPSQLGGCIILFFAMVLSNVLVPGSGDQAFDFLNPGAGLLAKWFPVFFVPGLVMLPLAPSVGSSIEVLKVLGVVILGLLFSLFTTAFAVLGLRTAMGAVEAAEEPEETKKATPARNKKAVAAPPAPPAPPKAFSDETMDFLIKGSVLSGAISIASTRINLDLATPLQTIFMLFVTFGSYVWGARLPSGFTKIVHPLVTSTALTLSVMRLTGIATDTPFMDVLGSYKVGSMDPLKTGAGDILLYLLGPSVVSFAIPMYSRKALLMDNLVPVTLAMLVSAAGGLFGTAAFARLIQLGGSGDNFLRRSVLTRNVTTALAIAITSILEGDIAICATVVVLTGVLGATYAKTLLTAAGVKDPVTRGLAVGGSSQGLGVASLADEKDAFPFATISMVLTAVCATVLVSIPVIKEALLSVLAGEIIVATAEGASV